MQPLEEQTPDQTPSYYLDHAATAPQSPAARKELLSLISGGLIYNPDSSYAPAVEFRRRLAELKKKTAKLLGVRAPSLFYTGGSSKANQLLLGLIFANQDFTPLEFITSKLEHSTLLSQLQSLKNIKLNFASTKPGTGLVDIASIKDLINDNTVLITIQYVNNELGTIQPIKELAQLVDRTRQDRTRRGVKTPLWLHTDASQAAKTEDLQIPRLGVDALSLNGSKFGAAPASGLLYLSADLLRWLDSRPFAKTRLNAAYAQKPSPIEVISIFYALEQAILKRQSESKRLLSLAKAFWRQLQISVPNAKLNPANLKIGVNHTGHILNIYLPEVKAEQLVILAGLNGLYFSTGAACSANKNTPSHVLTELGLSLEVVNSSIRVSFGAANRSEQEVIAAANLIAELLY
jgi:cysteine desulfurase